MIRQRAPFHLVNGRLYYNILGPPRKHAGLRGRYGEAVAALPQNEVGQEKKQSQLYLSLSGHTQL